MCRPWASRGRQALLHNSCITSCGNGGETVSDIEQAPPGVDTSRPSPARMYDYILGGTENYEIDREAAETVRASMPDLEDAAWANRGFLQRSVRWLAEQGIRQFIDIGAGLPTRNN